MILQRHANLDGQLTRLNYERIVSDGAPNVIISPTYTAPEITAWATATVGAATTIDDRR